MGASSTLLRHGYRCRCRWINISYMFIAVIVLHIYIGFIDAATATNAAVGEIYGVSNVQDIDGIVEVIDEVHQLKVGVTTKLRLYGSDFSAVNNSVSAVGLTDSSTLCDSLVFSECLKNTDNNGHTTIIDVKLDDVGLYYWCLFPSVQNTSSCSKLGKDAIHQGSKNPLRINVVKIKQPLIPVPAMIALVVCFLMLSGLFSGLNLGLMSLDLNGLKIVMKSGTMAERKYAKIIYPVRQRGNYLLCTILLGNVLVNNMATIFLSELSSGLVATLAATAAIVIFGEIVPQSICSRHGLAIGAKTIYVTRFFMIITAPISIPISWILDRVLGGEVGLFYNHEQLKHLFYDEGTTDLCGHEVALVTGALDFSKKTVNDVMTAMDDVVKMDINCTLNFHTLTEIISSGHSRIPVYDGDVNNIVGLLLVKDLAFIDPDDNTPLRTIIKFYKHVVHRVFSDTTLDKILDHFKSGQSHMSIVQMVNSDGIGDPFYENIGIVTLEDVLEELIQSEIVDETDVFTDNREKRVVQRQNQFDFKYFSTKNVDDESEISPQMMLAAFTYLHNTVDAFNSSSISEGVLKRLLAQSKKQTLRVQDFVLSDDSIAPELQLFSIGKESTEFVLVLQGHVVITVGQEGFSFDSGPFSYFGVGSLTTGGSYIADFSACVNNTAHILRITRAQYLMALNATKLEKATACERAILSHEEEIECYGTAPTGKIISVSNSSSENNISSDIPLEATLVNGDI